MIMVPFRLVGGLLGIAIRFVVAAVAVALMASGVLVSMTVVGAVIGVPIFVVGLFLLWKAVLG